MSLDAAVYDRFSVVAFGTAEVVAAVEQIRRALPPSGRPILPAHVTIKGTFVEPTDLDQIVERIRACCVEAQPFTLTTGDLHVWGDDTSGALVFEIEAPAAAVSLHRQLVKALQSLGTTIYHGEDIGVYTPHLTVVQQISPEEAHGAVPVVKGLSSGFTFGVTEVALVGRRGGTVWETLTTFPLGRAEG